MGGEAGWYEDYPGDDDDRAGDVIGALMVLKGLDGASSKEEDAWLDQLAEQIADPLRTGELLRGCSTLMLCWLGTMQPEDPLHVAAAILNRLRRLDTLDDTDLPMIAAILTCAVLDQSPVQWVRRAVAEFTAGEQRGWVLATWQVADLFDHCVERLGAALDMAERLLLELSAGPGSNEPA